MEPNNKRARNGLFITGTDTGVGKTVIGAALVRALAESGLSIQARKPVESGCEKQDEKLIPADGQCYFEAMRGSVPLDLITPYRFVAPLAPPQAAELEQQTLSVQSLLEATLAEVNTEDFCVVEGAGGFYSPLAHDGLNADLAKSLTHPVLIVAANRLGCINHILLTLQAVQHCGLESLAIVLNQNAPADLASHSNADAINRQTGIPVIATSHQAADLVGELQPLVEIILAKLKR